MIMYFIALQVFLFLSSMAKEVNELALRNIKKRNVFKVAFFDSATTTLPRKK